MTEKFCTDSQTSGDSSSSDASSSVSLVVGLRSGHSEAWRRMVDLYGPLVQSWCNIAGIPNDRVADVLQEVFLAVHRSVDRFEPSGGTSGFRGWLWTITRNKIHDHYRKLAADGDARGGSTALHHLQQLAEPELPVDEPSEVSDTTELLHRAMAMVRVEFRENTWQAFWRSAVLGQASDVIAEELGVTQAAVRQSKSRVLRRLRQTLGDLE